MIDTVRLDAALNALPDSYPGPGGAAAVIKDGALAGVRTWGYANAERRIPVTASTLFRLCSITKQFTCAAALSAAPSLEALEGAIGSRLPKLKGAKPRAVHLCHNQSGLRDYWAVAMMQGALAEDGFGDEEAAAVIGGAQTLQFEPGSRYCYANQNFRLLSDALQDVCGESFAALLRRHVLEPFGLETAILAADTRALPDGSEGYEGCAETGFRPARNRILWTGDAGLAASLQDMIAWERAIDQGRNDDGSIYQRLSAPSVFKDGRPAAYGFGLAHDQEFGRPITGHGGALRGWRSHRLHCASERLSVVVLFNHLSDARSAASALFAAALAETSAPAPDAPPPAWTGAYLDPQTGLSARVQSAEPGRVLVRFGHAAERLDLNGANEASGGGVTLVSSAQGLRMSRSRENLECLLQPAGEAHGPAPAGRFVCAELDAEITIAVTGSASYAAFSGPLGRGRMDKLEPIGTGLWLLPCHRALDHTPPGDFTIRAREGQGGAVELEVGCWLARGLRYQRRGLM